jgi:hypothetical protein
MKLSFDDEESFKEAVGSLRFDSNPPSDPNSVALALQEVDDSSDVLPQERNDEDICFNNDSQSDPNSLGRVGSSTPPQERSEDIDIIAA